MELARLIEKALQPIRRKLSVIATRGIVRLVNANTLMQELQVVGLGGEVFDKIEHWEPYGYTSNPKPGAEALLLSLGGDRGHTVAVNVAGRDFRLKGLQSGEVALYTDEGDVIHFKRGNNIEINAATKLTITAPVVDIDGDLKVTGAVSDATGTMDVIRTTYNAHTHIENDVGGPTNPPLPQM